MDVTGWKGTCGRVVVSYLREPNSTPLSLRLQRGGLEDILIIEEG